MFSSVVILVFIFCSSLISCSQIDQPGTLPYIYNAPPFVAMGTTKSFAILAGTDAVNEGVIHVTGNLGLYPGYNITGFQHDVFGEKHLHNNISRQAQADLTIAKADAASRLATQTVAGEIGSKTYFPGVVWSASSIIITGTVTLDAFHRTDASWIFLAGSSLTVIKGATVKIINQAPGAGNNVWWDVGSSATVGEGAMMIGTIMAQVSVTLLAGSSSGPVLVSAGAITVSQNVTVNATDPTFFTNAPSLPPNTRVPSFRPSKLPSTAPSVSPTVVLSNTPSITPSVAPSSAPAAVTSAAPNVAQSSAPVVISTPPSWTPSVAPSVAPSTGPTITPSNAPVSGSSSPSIAPSVSPSSSPLSNSGAPSIVLSVSPSSIPVSGATVEPSAAPTSPPVGTISVAPSTAPATSSSETPSVAPMAIITVAPSVAPVIINTVAPSVAPVSTAAPSSSPIAGSTFPPSVSPVCSPSTAPVHTGTSQSPSAVPIAAPSSQPVTTTSTVSPSFRSTSSPSQIPTLKPSIQTAPILSFDTAISISGFFAGSAAVGDSVTLSDVDKLTVQQTVADTMGLSRDDVEVISATVVTARRVLRSSHQIARRQLQSTSTISVLTQVVVSLLDFPEFASDPSGLYSSLVSGLSDVSAFETALHTNALSNNSPLTSSTVNTLTPTQPSVQNPPSLAPTTMPVGTSSSSSNGDKLSGGGIAGIIIGAVVFISALMCCAFGASHVSTSNQEAAGGNPPKIESLDPSEKATPLPDHDHSRPEPLTPSFASLKHPDFDHDHDNDNNHVEMLPRSGKSPGRDNNGDYHAVSLREDDVHTRDVEAAL